MKDRVSTVIINGILMIAVITMIIPMLLMLLFSLYESPELYESPLEFFKNIPTLTNYADIFITDTFGRYFLNSLFIACVVTIGNVLLGSMAGYAFARYDFKGKKLLFASVMGLMMVPHQVVMIPLYRNGCF